MLRSLGRYGVRMLEKRSWTATWRPSTTTARIAGMVGVIATRYWSDCGMSYGRCMRLGAYHDEIVRSNNVLDKELSSGVRYATLSRVLVEIASVTRDHLHVPFPVLVPSQASSFLPDVPALYLQ